MPRPGRPAGLRLLVATAIVVALAVPASLASGSSDQAHVLEDRAQSLRDRAAEARSQEGGLQQQIAAANDEIGALQARVDGLGSEVAALEVELDRAQARLAATEARLEEQTRQLQLLREQLGIAQRRLASRAVEIYTSEQPDLLSIVLGADSLDGLIDEIELYEQLLDQDSRLVADVGGLRRDVAATRAETERLRRRQGQETAALAGRTAERRDALASLVAERDRLAAARADRQQTLATLVVDRQQWEAEADQLEDESRQLAALVTQSAPAASASQGVAPASQGEAHQQTPVAATSSSGGFSWPLQGTITSPFGPRWGRLHSGLDIAAPAGTPVRAAAAGTVTFAGWMGDYGMIVVIDHGNGRSTAYSHNGSLAVTQGQTVSQGQTIAGVGCTGSCTGNHVHFEIRIGGTPVDPLGYL